MRLQGHACVAYSWLQPGWPSRASQGRASSTQMAAPLQPPTLVQACSGGAPTTRGAPRCAGRLPPAPPRCHSAAARRLPLPAPSAGGGGACDAVLPRLTAPAARRPPERQPAPPRPHRQRAALQRGGVWRPAGAPRLQRRRPAAGGSGSAWGERAGCAVRAARPLGAGLLARALAHALVRAGRHW